MHSRITDSLKTTKVRWRHNTGVRLYDPKPKILVRYKKRKQKWVPNTNDTFTAAKYYNETHGISFRFYYEAVIEKF